MTHNEISPDDAARALAEVAERRRQVAAAAPIPAWWWPVGAVAILLGGGLGDAPVSPMVAAYGQVLFGLVSCLAIVVVVLRQPVRPDPAQFGLGTWLLVAAMAPLFGVAIAAVGISTADIVVTTGGPLPGTASGLASGFVFAVGGPLAQRVVQRMRMRSVR